MKQWRESLPVQPFQGLRSESTDIACGLHIFPMEFLFRNRWQCEMKNRRQILKLVTNEKNCAALPYCKVYLALKLTWFCNMGSFVRQNDSYCPTREPILQSKRGYFKMKESLFCVKVNVSASYHSSKTLSTSRIQLSTMASVGIRQSPRGDRLTLPTLGPSGRQLRLNCWEKNRQKNV